MDNRLPLFHEHEQDRLIKLGYGIDESHDNGFYPYRIGDGGLPLYLKHDGLDVRCESYPQALEYVAEVAE